MSTRISVSHAVRIAAPFILALTCIWAPASPALAQGFSVAFGSSEFLVSPGDEFTGSIPVTNTSDEPRALRIYLGDRVRVPGQTSDYDFDEEGGKEPRSAMDWVVFSPERLTLEPGETRELTYEVSVPDDATLEGSYWAVIFIEGIPSEEPEIVPAGEGEIAIGLRTIFRYAIQIYATIEGTEVRDATFTALTMDPALGGFDATAVFENRGNTFLRPKVWLELRDVTGETVYTLEHEELTVLPESARDFVFELRDLPIQSGEYLVMIIADYGVPTLIAAQGRVNLTIAPPAEEQPAPEEGGGEGTGGEEPAEGGG
jgi:hypothetical protein